VPNAPAVYSLRALCTEGLVCAVARRQFFCH